MTRYSNEIYPEITIDYDSNPDDWEIVSIKIGGIEFKFADEDSQAVHDMVEAELKKQRG